MKRTYQALKGKNMELSGNTTINKLIMLFVFDKMDFPIMEDTVFNLCTMSNSWISWMECKETVAQLLETGFIYQSVHENKVYYSITPDGRMCLSHFYTRIPSSLRAEITEYVKENRMSFRRKQEYFRNYYKNADGSYTVQLKIMDPAQTMLEIKLNVSNRHTAKLVYNKWEEKAAQVFYSLHEQLVD